MKSEKKKILSGKECEVMNYLPYFKEPPIDVIKRYKTIKRYALICHDSIVKTAIKFSRFKFRKAAVNYIIRQSCILDFLTFP